MDHRNRRAPVALPGNTPVLNPICDGGLAEALLFGVRVHPAAGFSAREAREFAGVLGDSVVGESGLRVALKYSIYRSNHGTDRNAKSLSEIKIAIVVRRHSHDRARAVVDQYEIADPDGDFLTAIRMDSVVPGEYAVFADVP